MDRPPLVRRAPLGFGHGVIHDQPVTMTVRVTRPMVVERVFVVGAAIASRITVDGEPFDLAWDGFGYHLVDVPPAATHFALKLAPRVPRAAPKWWQFWKRRNERRDRGFTAGAKGIVAKDPP